MNSVRYAFRIALGFAIVISTLAQASFAQAVRNGLGDATSIITPDKVFGSTGNPHEIGDFRGSLPGQDTGAFSTRHLRPGEAGGLGGSFLGTTNVTAESSPARTGRVPENTVRALIPSQGGQSIQTRLFSQSMTESVAGSPLGTSPDISSQWNPGNPGIPGSPALPSSSAGLFSPSFSPSSSFSIDSFFGHQKSPASKPFSNTMGVPSYDSF